MPSLAQLGKISALLAVLAFGVSGGSFPSLAQERDAQPLSRTTPVENADQQIVIHRLIEQLGSNSYQTRELAEMQLAEIGIAAREGLQAALTSNDIEIRFRAARVLNVIEMDDVSRRIDEFAADVNDTRKLTLPGWQKFSARVGQHRAARNLFVSMQRAEAELLFAYDKRDNRQIQQHLDRVVTGSRAGIAPKMVVGGQVLSTPTATAMLFVASDPQSSSTPLANTALYRFTSSRGFGKGVGPGDPDRDMLLGMIRDWIMKDDRLDAEDDFRKVLVAQQHSLREGIVPALRCCKANGLQSTSRFRAILAFAKLGGDATIVPEIEHLLEDKTVSTQVMVENRVVSVEMRDGALLTMLLLTKQDPKEYGVEMVRPIPNIAPNYELGTFRFSDEKARDAALAKWKTWADQNLPKPLKFAPPEPIGYE